MAFRILHDRDEIATRLRAHPHLHVYSISDLDDFFWRLTVFFGSYSEADSLAAVAPLYCGMATPTLLGVCAGGPGSSEWQAMAELLRDIAYLLPGEFYGHLSPGLSDVLVAALPHGATVQDLGRHLKMGLIHPDAVHGIEVPEAVRLKEEDLREAQDLYAVSYPGNWFDARMLQTGQYWGIRHQSQLVSIAGVHGYSEQFSAAALGNITTHPEFRNRGLGRRVTARLCQDLVSRGIAVGLNVHQDNHSAIAAYGSIGFEEIGTYDEVLISSRRHPAALPAGVGPAS